MLEKLGLPPKPALKGNEWVLDASHCQTCSSAFTFFNRKHMSRLSICSQVYKSLRLKHHCRRCGGIFCGTCTQQRIYLRGQGDGPVRVCDACKIQEDAARFEMRHGHRNKATKHLAAFAGRTKAHGDVGDHETDSVLRELIHYESSAENSSKTDLMQEVDELIGSRDIPATSAGLSAGSIEARSDVSQSSSVTPEMLLLQAQELKRQWLALKKEGKGEAAMQAFKQAKEIERQAESLKLMMRRNTRKANVSVSRKDKQDNMKMEKKSSKAGAQTVPISNTDDDMHPTKAIPASRKKSEDKDDIMSALKDIGWSDADLREGNKTDSKTVEGELAELVSTMHNDEGKNRPKPTSSMEVLAHKRRALALKREGNLTEAKEELKKAKLLERQLEEQQMFDVEDDESDDELAALMRNLEKQETTGTTGIMDVSVFGNINSLDFNDEDDEGTEVTDMDINDPEMKAALRSIGWDEDSLMKKGSSNMTPYPHRLKETGRDVGQNSDGLNDPYYLSALVGFGDEPSELMRPVMVSIQKPSEKESLQQQISFLKKEAVALKRAGKVQEAKEEFHRAKVLEKSLKDSLSELTEEGIISSFSVDNVNPVKEIGVKSRDSLHIHEDFNEDDVDVTEEDMGDPELAKALESLGWKDDETETLAHVQVVNATRHSKTKPQLQKELLGIKRAALKLRREGKVEQAEEQLQKAQEIEDLIKTLSTDPPNLTSDRKLSTAVEHSSTIGNLTLEENLSNENDGDAHGQVPVGENLTSLYIQSAFSSGTVSSHRRENLGSQTDDNYKEIHHERAAEVNLSGSLDSGERRPGKEDSSASSISFSREEPTKVMELATKQISTGREPTVYVETPRDKEVVNFQRSEQNIQQEILTLKRRALALKREGKQAEAKEQLREAKLLEKKIEQSQSNPPAVEPGKQEPALPVSSSNDIGAGSSVGSHTSGAGLVEASSHLNADRRVIGKDRKKLQQESLAHKRKALALRREGKMDEAEAEFELAKSIERQMEELESSGETHSPMGFSVSGDAEGLDDVFDPQLFAALKGLGWNDSEILQAPIIRVEQETKDKRATVDITGVVPGSTQAEKNRKREELEGQIKAEKLRAVQLKRAGRQGEALDALRGAKQLEKKLQSLM